MLFRSIQDVLALGKQLAIPVVFDNLHHQLNHEPDPLPASVWIDRCRDTWTADDGPQKIHYSQQDPVRRGGSHSATIELNTFLEFCGEVGRADLDIMLEVKDKNRSAIKCQLAVDESPSRHRLEREWGRYKYSVLAHAPDAYLAIRQLMKNNCDVPVLPFYDGVATALAREVTAGQAENAALHVWGYFKNRAEESERRAFLKSLERYRSGRGSLKAVKNLLLRLTEKYTDHYLSDSYYFDLE